MREETVLCINKVLFITKCGDVCYAFLGWLWVECFPLVNLGLINVASFLNETKKGGQCGFFPP